MTNAAAIIGATYFMSASQKLPDHRAVHALADLQLRHRPIKFVLVHHGTCEEQTHYRISASGQTTAVLSESTRTRHANSIEVGLEGCFSRSPPPNVQIDALKSLLLELKQRYPDVTIGGHRQVRGSRTDCPGRKFPLKALLDWTRAGLLHARDAALREEVERQYHP